MTYKVIPNIVGICALGNITLCQMLLSIFSEIECFPGSNLYKKGFALHP